MPRRKAKARGVFVGPGRKTTDEVIDLTTGDNMTNTSRDRIQPGWRNRRAKDQR